MSVASPELLLSPSLLSASPELSTLLPLEEEINTVYYLPTQRRPAAAAAAATPNSSAIGPSFSLSQLLSSLQDYGGPVGGIGGGEEDTNGCGGDSFGGNNFGGCNTVDNNSEYILLDLRACSEPELEYVVFECACHSTVHFWRARGSSRPVRCYGPCGRILAAPGSVPATLRLQRTNLFYHFQYRQPKNHKMYAVILESRLAYHTYYFVKILNKGAVV